MRRLTRWRTITILFTLSAVIYAINTRQSHGTFLRVPFDFRMPTVRRFRERWWNPDDGRIFTPRVLGVGWSVNVHQVGKRLGLISPGSGDGAGEQSTSVEGPA
jgi:uncharacterized membrane protein